LPNRLQVPLDDGRVRLLAQRSPLRGPQGNLHPLRFDHTKQVLLRFQTGGLRPLQNHPEPPTRQVCQVHRLSQPRKAKSPSHQQCTGCPNIELRLVRTDRQILIENSPTALFARRLNRHGSPIHDPSVGITYQKRPLQMQPIRITQLDLKLGNLAADKDVSRPAGPQRRTRHPVDDDIVEPRRAVDVLMDHAVRAEARRLPNGLLDHPQRQRHVPRLRRLAPHVQRDRLPIIRPRLSAHQPALLFGSLKHLPLAVQQADTHIRPGRRQPLRADPGHHQIVAVPSDGDIPPVVPVGHRPAVQVQSKTRRSRVPDGPVQSPFRIDRKSPGFDFAPTRRQLTEVVHRPFAEVEHPQHTPQGQRRARNPGASRFRDRGGRARPRQPVAGDPIARSRTPRRG